MKGRGFHKDMSGAVCYRLHSHCVWNFLQSVETVWREGKEVELCKRNCIVLRTVEMSHLSKVICRYSVVTICTTSLTFTNPTFCPHSVFVFCVDLRINSDYFPIQHLLTGFYR
jgi:hypothetical protein